MGKFRELDKAQQKAMAEAWGLHSKIINEILVLAKMNIPLAYGVIRTAETLIDHLYIVEIHQAERKENQQPKMPL